MIAGGCGSGWVLLGLRMGHNWESWEGRKSGKWEETLEIGKNLVRIQRLPEKSVGKLLIERIMDEN